MIGLLRPMEAANILKTPHILYRHIRGIGGGLIRVCPSYYPQLVKLFG